MYSKEPQSVLADLDYAASAALLDLPYAYGEPSARAEIKRYPIDFKVDEVLGFEPDGEGEHVFLSIRKADQNTDHIAGLLAKLAKVPRHAVSYAGLKDRRAVTTQWFSVHLPKQPEPNWHDIESDEIEIMAITRHRRKLKRGTHQGNRFRLVLRDCEGAQAEFNTRLEQIARGGVPNYFGSQRFGREGNNLRQALALLTNPSKRMPRARRSLYLSAARSFLFNQVLAERIQQKCWDKALLGDVMMLSGSQSIFVVDSISDDIEKRISDQAIHPTGPLCGGGEGLTQKDAKQLEQQVLSNYPEFVKGLEQAGLEHARRPLRFSVEDLQCHFISSSTLELEFYLARGCYATSVLRELASVR